MKNLYTFSILIICLLLSFQISAQNKLNVSSDEAGTFQSNFLGNPQPSSALQAPWDILFNYDLLAITGANGNAAVCFTGTQFWVSRWATDTLIRIDAAGNFIEKFTIAGVTGVRSLTTDGTYFYAGVNTNSIKVIDPVNKTLVTTITAPVTNVRSLTYDAAANSGAGGFWVSTWDTDITLINMTGTMLSSIPAASHGLQGMYGTAVDNVSPGGPFLWVFDQFYSSDSADIVQIDIATQLQTGIFHNVKSDVGTIGIAGGIFAHAQGGGLTLIGVLQGNPNRLFGYEWVAVGIEENFNNSSFINIGPNPVSDWLNINLNKENNDLVLLEIFDVTGKTIFSKNTRGLNNYINLSEYDKGLYFVKATYNDKIYSNKFIKQ